MKKIAQTSQLLATHLREHYNVEEGDEIFFLSHVLSHLILSCPADTINRDLKIQSKRFALRKLKAALQVLSTLSNL